MTLHVFAWWSPRLGLEGQNVYPDPASLVTQIQDEHKIYQNISGSAWINITKHWSGCGKHGILSPQSLQGKKHRSFMWWSKPFRKTLYPITQSYTISSVHTYKIKPTHSAQGNSIYTVLPTVIANWPLWGIPRRDIRKPWQSNTSWTRVACLEKRSWGPRFGIEIEWKLASCLETSVGMDLNKLNWRCLPNFWNITAKAMTKTDAPQHLQTETRNHLKLNIY